QARMDGADRRHVSRAARRPWPGVTTAPPRATRTANLAAHQDILDDGLAGEARIAGEFQERLQWLDERLQDGRYEEAVAGSYAKAKARMASAVPRDTLHVVGAEDDIRCVPMSEGLFEPPADIAFDRNRCSRLHLGEVIRVLREADDGAWLYVHAGHSVGWLHTPTLSPASTAEVTAPFRGVGTYAVFTSDTKVGDRQLRMGRRFPLRGRTDGGWQIDLPTTTGFETVTLTTDAPLHEGPMPLTRANVWRLVMARQGEPYGWGGYEGGRDCSRLLLDLFAVFGIHLGRHSLVQAKSGSHIIELTSMSEPAKLEALRSAASRGLVLAYMPGHIMLHLGEVDGRPYALSSLAQYFRPCTGGDQTVRIARITVSDYELGRGSKRTSFLERLTKLTILGGP
ncbi:MAG: SH3 domain-containing protein, partial [Myxococcota bacterium]|nr:SH3 domain-containing protein [Myxococcota bacterium]